MKKVFWLIQQLNNVGGTEMVSIDIMNELAKDDNYKITLVCMTSKPTEEIYNISPKIEIKYLNIPLDYVIFSNAISKYCKKKAFHKAIALIFKTIGHVFFKRFKYRKILKEMTTKKDTIVASSWDNYIICPKERHVLYHFHFNSKFFFSMTNKIGLLFCRKPDNFIFLTKETKDKIKNKDKRYQKAIYINNPGRFDRNLDTTPKGNNLIFLGRFSQQKRPLLTLEVANRLKDMKQDFHLNIYGAGPLQSNMQEYIEEHNLNLLVTINNPTKDVKSALRQNDMLLLTSAYEGFPLVLIEAASQSLPSISTYWGDGTDIAILDNKTGYIINDDNLDEYANKIAYLLQNPEQLTQMKQAAYDHSSKFLLKNIIKYWKKILDK